MRRCSAQTLRHWELYCRRLSSPRGSYPFVQWCYRRGIAGTTGSNKPPNDILDDQLTEWIPPDRPLSGDMGQPSSYSEHDENEDVEDELPSTTEEPIDWLATRRAKQHQEATAMVFPSKNRRFAGAELEILPGVLLSANEIEQCLTSMGAVNHRIILDHRRRLDGAEGLIFVTATSSQHLNLLADTLVRQLKRRKLSELGVSGARYGAEGGAGDTEEWKVVDCRNYVVHIMLEETRRQLNLEALWEGDDDLLRIELNDDESVDDYVAANPAPMEFGTVDNADVMDTVSSLRRWNMPHRQVVNKPRRKLRKRRRRR